MRYFLLRSIFVGFLVLSGELSQAQSLNDTLRLQTIHITAPRTPGKTHETRTSIDSVSLAKSITIRLSELLSQNTPLFIKEYGRGAMATASFRGTAPSHTKVSWNGLELNSPMLGMVDFSLIPVYFTEEVNLLHGSSSMSESAGALGGTIRLENKANWSNSLSGKLLTSCGSYQTVDEFGQISFGNRKCQSKSAFFYNASKNDFSFLNKLNAEIDPKDGSYLYPTEINKNADYKNYGILQELYWQISDKQTLSLKTWFQRNERSIPQLLTNESNDAANVNRQIENALRSVAEWRRFGIRSRISVLSAINIQNSSFSLENSVNGASNQVVVDTEAKVTSFVNKFSYRIQFDKFFTLLTGADINFHKVLSENLLPSPQSAEYNKNRFENSFFAKLEMQWNPNWSNTFLVREEVIDLKHKGVLPLLRVNYQPNPSHPLLFSASIARNNHLPTLNDLYYLPGGNPLLKSEKCNLLDLGANDDFTFRNNRINVGISLFYSKTNDWIIWLPTFQGYWEPDNIERVESNGIEANAGWLGKIGPIRCQVKANYAYTRTLNLSEDSPAYGKQLPYVPENSANMNIHLSWLNMDFDWMWNYYSKRYTTTANSEETASDYLYPYFMNNLQISRTFHLKTKRLTAECKVHNIFNEDYRTVLQRPMPGRNYQLVLSYEF